MMKLSIDTGVDLKSLSQQTGGLKLGKDRRGRIVDAATGKRVHFVSYVDMSGAASDPKDPGKAEVILPGQTFKMRCGKEYMVMPSGAIRRITSRKGEA